MCQTKAQGGKRCSAHMSGSMATVSLTSRIAEVQEKIVRKVFGSLKKEGKGLEAPLKEEVVSYAETGRFLTKYNNDIPERQKKTIMAQFEKAKDENPDGAVFHAWKHTLPEVLRRTRKTFMATGVAGALMFTSACGGSAGINNDATPAPSSSPTSISQTETPAPTPVPVETTQAPVPGDVINGMATKEVVNNGRGEYIQTTIAQNDPALTYNPSISDPVATQHFTHAELETMQKETVTFISEETIDSSANGGGNASFDQWWAKNKDNFVADQQEAIYQTAKEKESTDPIVIRGQWRDGKYDFAYDANAPRMVSKTITPTSIVGAVAPDGRPYAALTASIEYKANVIVDGKPSVETVNGVATYSMIKNDAGEWKIGGYTADYTARLPS